MAVVSRPRERELTDWAVANRIAIRRVMKASSTVSAALVTRRLMINCVVTEPVTAYKDASPSAQPTAAAAL